MSVRELPTTHPTARIVEVWFLHELLHIGISQRVEHPTPEFQSCCWVPGTSILILLLDQVVKSEQQVSFERAAAQKSCQNRA